MEAKQEELSHGCCRRAVSHGISHCHGTQQKPRRDQRAIYEVKAKKPTVEMGFFRNIAASLGLAGLELTANTPYKPKVRLRVYLNVCVHSMYELLRF